MKQSLVYMALLSTMLTLAGCGGGGGGNDSNQDNNSGSNDTGNNNQNNGNNQNNTNNQNNGNTNQQIDGEVWVVKGRVQDADNRYVENAKVSVVLDNIEYSTKTDKNGEYGLKLPKDFKYPEYLSGVIHAEGYKPKTLLLSYEDKTLFVDEESNSPTIHKLQEHDVIFFNGLKVIHLGDDSFSGSANSQFQVKAQDIVWKDSFTYSAAKKAKYDEICISLMGKGIQSSSSKDTISLSRNGEAGTFVTQGLKDSAESGIYSNIEHCFSLQSFNADEQIELRIQSGNASNGYDDFEIINIEGAFKNNSGSNNSSGSGNSDGTNNSGSNNSSGSGNNTGGNSSSGGSSDIPLCNSGTTPAGTVQCVGKDNINYLGGGFNSHTGDVAGYMDHASGDIQTATSCSVVRSGNTMTINIPSLSVSGTVTGEALQVITPSSQEGQTLMFLTAQDKKFGMMQNTFYNGQVLHTATVTIGDKTYSCSKY